VTPSLSFLLSTLFSFSDIVLLLITLLSFTIFLFLCLFILLFLSIYLSWTGRDSCQSLVPYLPYLFLLALWMAVGLGPACDLAAIYPPKYISPYPPFPPVISRIAIAV
jgi:hypothetical protein